MTATSLGSVDLDGLLAAKADTSVTVCLPAHNEADTIGPIIEAVRDELVVGVPLVDSILVIDDASSDETTSVAASAGATVVANETILPAAGFRRGKGEVMWKALAASTSDVIVWIDADIVDFDPQFVTRLVEPLLLDDDLVFVKGHYNRPVGANGLPGGRVTELVARPALSMYHPKLSIFAQPLSGEIAARRDVLTRLRFASGYGVDVGLLIDVADAYGIDRIAQADLGVRIHRNRPLIELAPQAFEVLHTILDRAEVQPSGGGSLLDASGIATHTRFDDRPAMRTVPREWLDT